MRAGWIAAALRALTLSTVLAAACGEEAESRDAGQKVEAKAAEEPKAEARADAGIEGVPDAGAPADGRGAEGAKAPKKKSDADAFVGTEDDLRQIADALEDRRVALDLREREVIQREQMVENLEIAAAQKTEQLKALEAEAAAILDKLATRYEDVRKTYDEERKDRAAELKDAVDAMAAEREDRTTQLVASIKGMRPSAGASLLASMNEDDAVDVLRRLSARQSAALLGEMPPKKAAELAEAMIGPRLPSAGLLPSVDENEEAKP